MVTSNAATGSEEAASMHDTMLSLGPSLSMHELSLSMPEPMLSLSMLILATTSGSCVGRHPSNSWAELTSPNFNILTLCSQRDGFRQPYSNFSNRPHPLAQNRGTILMGIAVWRVAEEAKIAIWVGDRRRRGGNPLPDQARSSQPALKPLPPRYQRVQC